jgi:hypothetical protein
MAPTKSSAPHSTNYAVCSFPRGDKNEFRLDAGDQIKVLITMQKRHAAKNSVRCFDPNSKWMRK